MELLEKLFIVFVVIGVLWLLIKLSIIRLIIKSIGFVLGMIFAAVFL